MKKHIIALMLCFATSAYAEAPPPAAPTVKVASPKMQKITEWDEYTGRFEAAKRVEIRSRISGYLQSVQFKDGQIVKQGQTLFIIDQRPLKIALTKAQARYDLAAKEYARAKGLRAGNVISQQSLERISAVYIEAQSALEEAKLELDFSEIKSPIAGRVSRHMVDVGNLISGGNEGATILTTVVAESPIYFYFEASEQDLLKYIRLEKAGKRETARNDAKHVAVKLQDETEFMHDGVMDFVDNEIDKATGSIQGRAVFANADGVLLAGMFGRLRIAGSDEYEAMLIPDEAVATNQSQKIVFMVNERGIVEPRPVELGGLHDGNGSQAKWRIVKSGLHLSDKIIWQGLAKVRPNMAVMTEEVTEP